MASLVSMVEPISHAFMLLTTITPRTATLRGSLSVAAQRLRSAVLCFCCFEYAPSLCLFLHFKDDDKVARTLITQIPQEISDTSLIIKHFHEAYPSCTVTDVQFCYDVQRLIKLDSERRKAMNGRMYFAGRSQKEGKIMIKTHPCARLCCCDCWGFKQVEADQYYAELEKLTDEFTAERNQITLKRLGLAFVTFQDERMTALSNSSDGKTDPVNSEGPVYCNRCLPSKYLYYSDITWQISYLQSI